MQLFCAEIFFLLALFWGLLQIITICAFSEQHLLLNTINAFTMSTTTCSSRLCHCNNSFDLRCKCLIPITDDLLFLTVKHGRYPLAILQEGVTDTYPARLSYYATAKDFNPERTADLLTWSCPPDAVNVAKWQQCPERVGTALDLLGDNYDVQNTSTTMNRLLAHAIGLTQEEADEFVEEREHQKVSYVIEELRMNLCEDIADDGQEVYVEPQHQYLLRFDEADNLPVWAATEVIQHAFRRFRKTTRGQELVQKFDAALTLTQWAARRLRSWHRVRNMHANACGLVIAHVAFYVGVWHKHTSFFNRVATTSNSVRPEQLLKPLTLLQLAIYVKHGPGTQDENIDYLPSKVVAYAHNTEVGELAMKFVRMLQAVTKEYHQVTTSLQNQISSGVAAGARRKIRRNLKVLANEHEALSKMFTAAIAFCAAYKTSTVPLNPEGLSLPEIRAKALSDVKANTLTYWGLLEDAVQQSDHYIHLTNVPRDVTENVYLTIIDQYQGLLALLQRTASTYDTFHLGETV